jgi:hypothetical protein
MEEPPQKMPGRTWAHRKPVIPFRDATGLAIAKFHGIYIEAVGSAGPHPRDALSSVRVILLSVAARARAQWRRRHIDFVVGARHPDLT